jgi:hypothetical protein
MAVAFTRLLRLSILLGTAITSVRLTITTSGVPIQRPFSFASLLLLQGLVPAAMAQINSGSTEAQRSMKLAGGWYDAEVDDPDVLDAAAFCLQSLQTQVLDSERRKPEYSFVTTSTTTLKVIQATKQVVAGMNYALTLMVLDGNSCLGAFKATVYNRFGELSVTKWSEEITCTEGTIEADQLDQNGDSN